LGFGLALHPSTPGWMMPAPHWHDCLEINYVRQGQGLYTYALPTSGREQHQDGRGLRRSGQ